MILSGGNGSYNVVAEDISWNIIQITDNSIVDEHPVIVLDVENNIHITWAGGTVFGETVEGDLEVFYAVKKGSSDWEIFQITDNDERDQLPILAVDLNGNAHIVWWRKVPDRSNEIYYATNAEGSWQTTTITQDNVNDVRPTIEVDLEGIPHIAWQREGDRSWDIFYAKHSGNSWDIQQVTDKSANCYSPSLVFDSQNEPYVAWWEQPSSEFKSAEIFYGVPNVDKWKHYQVTGNSFGERDPILVFDSFDRPRMVWTGQTDNNNVLYAENELACSCRPWEIFQLTTNEDHDEEPNFFMGSDNMMHLVWERGGEIHYTGGYSGSTSWDSMRITTGHNPWVAVDEDKAVYIVYFDMLPEKMESDIFLATTNPDIKPTQTTTVNTITTISIATSSVDEFGFKLEGLLLVFGLVLLIEKKRRN